MKLILVAKTDLKDTRNSVGTITLGTDFKTNVHANAPQNFNSNPQLLLQEIKLLKKRSNLISYPINLYVISISDQVYQRLKNQTSPDILLDQVSLPVNDYNLVGYIQAHKNKFFSVVLNADFNDEENFTRIINLAKQLNLDNNVEEVSYQHLGYCNKLSKNMPLGQDLYQSASTNTPKKSTQHQAIPQPKKK